MAPDIILVPLDAKTSMNVCIILVFMEGRATMVAQGSCVNAPVITKVISVNGLLFPRGSMHYLVLWLSWQSSFPFYSLVSRKLVLMVAALRCLQRFKLCEEKMTGKISCLLFSSFFVL